jgi:hypothetical protein
MTYLTLEVDIQNGTIIPREPGKLPENGSGLLTVLQGAPELAALRPAGLAKGEFVVPADFNAPLPEDVLREFQAK